jgi:hypothetical protein
MAVLRRKSSIPTINQNILASILCFANRPASFTRSSKDQPRTLLSPIPQANESCAFIPISSEDIKIYVTQAWAEVRPIAEVLPRSTRSSFARFFPTDACDAPFNEVVLELKVREKKKTIIFAPSFTSISDNIWTKAQLAKTNLPATFSTAGK